MVSLGTRQGICFLPWLSEPPFRCHFEPRPGEPGRGEVAPDGQRFLKNVPPGGADASPTITVGLNWTAGLKKK
ncbi:MAG: hypothetical protein HY651_10060 [Acidobacteria bacterium]|nr:hypothetical protein [Acidobacteriota bacterium]